MDSSCLIDSIAIALDVLWHQRKQSTDSIDRLDSGIIMRWLWAVRTFYFCSAMLANNVELRTDGNGDNAVTSLRSQKKKMKQKKRKMRKSMGSLLVIVEDIVRRILYIHHGPYDFRYDIKSSEEKMDEWYTSLTAFLKKYSTSPSANQIKVIADSVLENLKDFPTSRVGYDALFKEELRQIEALKKNITIMRNIICFGTLLATENQEFQCLLSHIEPLVVSAAHLTHRLFSNIKRPMFRPNDVTSSMLSALLSKIDHVSNLLLHEKYAQALASLKYSRELCDPTLPRALL